MKMVIIAQFYKKLIFLFFIFHFHFFNFFQIFLFDNIPLKNIFSTSTKSQFNSNSIKSYRSFFFQLQIILTYVWVCREDYLIIENTSPVNKPNEQFEAFQGEKVGKPKNCYLEKWNHRCGKWQVFAEACTSAFKKIWNDVKTFTVRSIK